MKQKRPPEGRGISPVPVVPPVTDLVDTHADTTGISRSEAIKILHDTWHSHFWDSAKLLAQAWAFYLTIMAALIGFILTRNLAPWIEDRLLLAGLVISVIHLVGFWLWGRATARLAWTLEHLTRELNRSAFAEFGFDGVFLRWKTTQRIVIVNSATIVLTIIVGTVVSLFR